MVASGVVRPLAMMLGAAAFLAACAGSSPKGEYLTLRTSQGSNQLSLASGGNIIGPTLQLAPTSDGYRGMADASLVELRSDGERITGTIHDQMVDLHVSVPDEGGLLFRGLFGGRLGRVDANNYYIRSTLGVCSYELEAKGTRYEGRRACMRSRLPSVRAAYLELPRGFERLRPDRQAMLLAILLTQ